MNQECVVTFKNEDRQIAMYFTEKDGELNMQMTINPELGDNEEKDLTLFLAGVFMNALHVDNTENEQPESEIITS